MVVMGLVLNLMIKEAFWFGGCRRQRERERERVRDTIYCICLFIFQTKYLFNLRKKEDKVFVLPNRMFWLWPTRK